MEGNIYIYIYIYIGRERERERERKGAQERGKEKWPEGREERDKAQKYIHTAEMEQKRETKQKEHNRDGKNRHKFAN
jgi:hypothetical protein